MLRYGTCILKVDVLRGDQHIEHMCCSTYDLLSAVGRYVELLL